MSIESASAIKAYNQIIDNLKNELLDLKKVHEQENNKHNLEVKKLKDELENSSIDKTIKLQ